MVIAVDFDGTLCKSCWPDIGEPNTELLQRLIRLKEQGNELILWTMREGKTLNNAVNWCKKQGLTFDAVNDNLDRMKKQYGNNPRKVFADVYIDDHNVFVTEKDCKCTLFSAYGSNESFCMKEE